MRSAVRRRRRRGWAGPAPARSALATRRCARGADGGRWKHGPRGLESVEQGDSLGAERSVQVDLVDLPVQPLPTLADLAFLGLELDEGVADVGRVHQQPLGSGVRGLVPRQGRGCRLVNRGGAGETQPPGGPSPLGVPSDRGHRGIAMLERVQAWADGRAGTEGAELNEKERDGTRKRRSARARE